ncbi:MAG TPA: aminopeptidase [Spirochaetota bacterium]|nr:aminopeptidase [Spirochaetota bacterium]HPJ35882.1 aminopeptidase [Spirochaetota bacterium]
MTVKEDNKKKNKKLEEKLFYKKESAWTDLPDQDHKKIFTFSEGYKKFLTDSATERLCIKNISAVLEKAGFKNIENIKSVKKGDRVYRSFKGKTLIAFVAGEDPESIRLIGSHVDSPRLDLKPNPLYQNSELALLQSHYYGGIKKFHWVNTPLEMHGVIFRKSGKEIILRIGAEEGDPKFIIPDLLPHLAKEQMKKDGTKVIEGEDLNILFGHIPVRDKDIKEKIKFNILKYLNETYGIIEEDFICSELEFVPSQKPVDIGLDRGLIGAYGQDDRVCVYTSLMAIAATEKPAHTAVAYFSDKEETGSYGDTGAESFSLMNFANEYARLTGIKKDPWKLLESAKAISADVTAAMDPTFSSVNDPQNVSFLGKGISIEKYGGGGGKYNTNDAHAEYMQYMRHLADRNKIPWQTGEMGKLDIGGGGTIAMLMSRYGMDCLDAGPSLLGMHSVCEVASKADIYAAFLLYKAFFAE